MTRVDIINEIIKLNNYKSYLEIGFWKGGTFNNIVCPHKVSVDPLEDAGATCEMTSDDFFAQNEETFDLFFIDGLHHADQVVKDIDNALEIMNDGGLILVHDCLPRNEGMQKVPREQGIWTGDVWKAMVELRKNNSVSFKVVDTDVGIGVVWKEESNYQPVLDELNWNNFVSYRDQWLNVVTMNDFDMANPKIQKVGVHLRVA